MIWAMAPWGTHPVVGDSFPRHTVTKPMLESSMNVRKITTWRSKSAPRAAT